MGIKITDSQINAVDQMLQNAPYFVTASALLVTGKVDTREQANYLLHQYAKKSCHSVLYALTVINSTGILDIKFMNKANAEQWVKSGNVVDVAVSAVYKEDIDIFEALSDANLNEDLARKLIEQSEPVSVSEGLKKGAKQNVSVEVAFGNMKLQGAATNQKKELKKDNSAAHFKKKEETKKEEIQVTTMAEPKEEKKEEQKKKGRPAKKKEVGGGGIFTMDDDQGLNKEAKLLVQESEEEREDKDDNKKKKGGKRKKREVSQKPAKKKRDSSAQLDQLVQQVQEEAKKESQEEFIRVKKTKTEKQTITVQDEKGYLVTKEIVATKEYFVNVKKNAAPPQRTPKKQEKAQKSQKSLSSYFGKK